MALEKLGHYSLENPASVYDEEAMTALELAARTAAKANETVEAFNEHEERTTEHLAQQDNAMGEWFARQDANIREMINVTMPNEVDHEVARYIAQGHFDAAISEYADDLQGRVDNLLGSVSEGSTTLDAEVIDMRRGDDGLVYLNAGTATRMMFQKIPYTKGNLETGTDANTMTAVNGYWCIRNNKEYANLPITNGFLEVRANTTGRAVQIVTEWETMRQHKRSWTESTGWTEWKEDYELPKGILADGADADYLYDYDATFNISTANEYLNLPGRNGVLMCFADGAKDSNGTRNGKAVQLFFDASTGAISSRVYAFYLNAWTEWASGGAGGASGGGSDKGALTMGDDLNTTLVPGVYNVRQTSVEEDGATVKYGPDNSPVTNGLLVCSVGGGESGKLLQVLTDYATGKKHQRFYSFAMQTWGDWETFTPDAPAVEEPETPEAATERKIIVTSSPAEALVTVFVPTVDGYVAHCVQRTEDPNRSGWYVVGLRGGYKANDNFEKVFQLYTEGEVCRVTTIDNTFFGGHMHGCENMYNCIFLVDGVNTNLFNNQLTMECDSLRVIYRAARYNPIDFASYGDEIVVSVEMCEMIFTKECVEIYHESNPRIALTPETQYHFMLPICRKDGDIQITQTYYCDRGYSMFDVSESNFNNDASTETVNRNRQMLYGANSRVFVEVIVDNQRILDNTTGQEVTYPTLGFVSNNESYNKLYFKVKDSEPNHTTYQTIKNHAKFKITCS